MTDPQPEAARGCQWSHTSNSLRVRLCNTTTIMQKPTQMTRHRDDRSTIQSNIMNLKLSRCQTLRRLGRSTTMYVVSKMAVVVVCRCIEVPNKTDHVWVVRDLELHLCVCTRSSLRASECLSTGNELMTIFVCSRPWCLPMYSIPPRCLSPACTLPLTVPANPFPVVTVSPMPPLSLQDGYTPLHWAAESGHTQLVMEWCVQKL